MVCKDEDYKKNIYKSGINVSQSLFSNLFLFVSQTGADRIILYTDKLATQNSASTDNRLVVVSCLLTSMILRLSRHEKKEENFVMK